MGWKARIKGRLRLPSAGFVISCIALSVALGGTATALQGTRTVQDNDLKTNSVKKRAIASGAVQNLELGTIVTRVETTAIPDGGSGRAEAECDDGERLIGGGGETQQSATDAIYHGSHPSTGGGNRPVDGGEFDAWNAKATNVAGGLATVDVKAWAICLQ